MARCQPVYDVELSKFRCNMAGKVQQGEVRLPPLLRVNCAKHQDINIRGKLRRRDMAISMQRDPDKCAGPTRGTKGTREKSRQVRVLRPFLLPVPQRPIS